MQRKWIGTRLKALELWYGVVEMKLYEREVILEEGG